jgi:hypothetical protein
MPAVDWQEAFVLKVNGPPTMNNNINNTVVVDTVDIIPSSSRNVSYLVTTYI